MPESVREQWESDYKAGIIDEVVNLLESEAGVVLLRGTDHTNFLERLHSALAALNGSRDLAVQKLHESLKEMAPNGEWM